MNVIILNYKFKNLIKTLIYFLKRIDYILVPPHDFVEQSTWWRVKNMYLKVSLLSFSKIFSPVITAKQGCRFAILFYAYITIKKLFCLRF